MRVCSVILLIFVELNVALGDDIKTQQKGDKTTAVAPENDDRLLLFATLDGSLVNVDRFSGDVKWNVKDRPTVEVPLNVEGATDPIFLPDPRDGSLYLLDNSREPIKKLPFTIPQLVASSPCKSSDGILYTGKKKDAWFKLDPITGMRQQVIGWDTSSPTCPIETSLFVYIGRSKYNIAMIDSNKPDRRWNVTFFDYTSKAVGIEDLAKFGRRDAIPANDEVICLVGLCYNYENVGRPIKKSTERFSGSTHVLKMSLGLPSGSEQEELVLFASSSTGKIIALDRRSGHFLWEIDLESPVVGMYLLDSEGLITVPYTMLANHTITYLSSELSTSDQIFDQKGRMKLYPTLYIGQHKSGLYAIPSLVDQNVMTITSSDAGKLLLSGPNGPEEPPPYPDIPIPGQNYYLPPEMYDGNSFTFQSIPGLSNHISIYTGHYNVPKLSNLHFILPEKVEPLKLISDGTVVIRKRKKWNDHNRFTDIESEPDNVDMDDDEYCNISNSTKRHWNLMNYINNYAEIYQDMNDLQRTLVTLVGVIFVSTVYIVVVVHLLIRRKLNKGMDSANGILKIGKIKVYLKECIGSGREGTMVYRGEFEGRPLAVKRFMTEGPKQLELIKQEVALLKESDDHPNVIRYFCMEEDISFRYIALELCQATVFEYIENSLDSLPITPLQIIRQTTEGLAHLHSLGIVHRDLKPHNVLISMNDTAGNVKALISDFGFCKKLQTGKYSFSGPSIEGSEGWTAPEMLAKGPQRMTPTVDIFSLGCLFYYVLSNGAHPFGDILYRKANIAGGAPCDLSCLKGKDWEVNTQLSLIKSMVSMDPEERPNCSSILSHPMFWDTTKILNFFQDVSDRVEILKGDDEVLKSLESGGDYIVFQDWGNYIHQDLIVDLRKFRTYFGRSVRDLLRALRNKKNHHRELTEEAQRVLGDFPDGYCHYWVERFPLLLIHTYLSMQCVANETVFSGYYRGGHKYSINDLREQAELYCQSRNIFIDDNIPPMELSPHRSPKRQKQSSTSSREGSGTKIYRNRGPLKSKRKKPAHKSDEPQQWLLHSNTSYDIDGDQENPDGENNLEENNYVD